jgi:hypothetical protein
LHPVRVAILRTYFRVKENDLGSVRPFLQLLFWYRLLESACTRLSDIDSPRVRACHPHGHSTRYGPQSVGRSNVVGGSSAMASAAPSTHTESRLEAPTQLTTVRFPPVARVQYIRYQLDSCLGTNRRQFCFDSLALLPPLGMLDFRRLCFMVLGHLKLSPDNITHQLKRF